MPEKYSIHSRENTVFERKGKKKNRHDNLPPNLEDQFQDIVHFGATPWILMK